MDDHDGENTEKKPSTIRKVIDTICGFYKEHEAAFQWGFLGSDVLNVVGDVFQSVVMIKAGGNGVWIGCTLLAVSLLANGVYNIQKRRGRIFDTDFMRLSVFCMEAAALAAGLAMFYDEDPSRWSEVTVVEKVNVIFTIFMLVVYGFLFVIAFTLPFGQAPAAIALYRDRSVAGILGCIECCFPAKPYTGPEEDREKGCNESCSEEQDPEAGNCVCNCLLVVYIPISFMIAAYALFEFTIKGCDEQDATKWCKDPYDRETRDEASDAGTFIGYSCFLFLVCFISFGINLFWPMDDDYGDAFE